MIWFQFENDDLYGDIGMKLRRKNGCNLELEKGSRWKERIRLIKLYLN